MKLRCSHQIGSLIAMATAAFAILLAVAGRPASAFTRADADAAVNAYLKAFVRPDGTTAFIKGDQNGGDPGFWQEIERDRGDRGRQRPDARRLQNPGRRAAERVRKAHGVNWSNNIYNDDISWAAIAYTRGYQATGDASVPHHRQEQLRHDVRPRLGPRQGLPLLDDQEHQLQLLHRVSRPASPPTC